MQAFITYDQFDKLIAELQKKLPNFERMGDTFIFKSKGEVGSLWFSDSGEDKSMKIVLMGNRLLECYNAVVKFRYIPRDSVEYEKLTPVLPVETKIVYPKEIPNTERME